MNQRVIDFTPSKQNALIEEAIAEAIAKARETGVTYRFNCNGLPMLIDSKSDADDLLNKYWQFDHENGVANGSILTTKINMSSGTVSD